MRNISVGILAGGKSSRMGCNKAELWYHDKTFLEHLAEEAAAFDEILVSVEAQAAREDGRYMFVADEIAEFGPVEGIYQLLLHAGNPYVLVIATDMQNLNAAFLKAFTEQLLPEDRCMVLRNGTFLEPLCCVYHKDMLPLFRQLREEGIRRPRAVFSRVPVHYVDLEQLGYSANVVDNINTKEEYSRFLREKER